jgi:hypothetical protein
MLVLVGLVVAEAVAATTAAAKYGYKYDLAYRFLPQTAAFPGPATVAARIGKDAKKPAWVDFRPLNMCETVE